MNAKAVNIVGTGVALAGTRDPNSLRRREAIEGEIDPAAVLGRRGLLYKDRATQLALCAGKDALESASLLSDEMLNVAGESVAVVVSSNLGNLDTICKVSDLIATQTSTAVSPMDLPNASSNVIASSISIRFGLRGPSLMLCNGATGGLDAIYWASVLIRSGRASWVVVVGVETSNHVVERLVGPNNDTNLIDGAGAVVLASAASVQSGADSLGTVGFYARAGDIQSCLAQVEQPSDSSPEIWFLSDGHADSVAGEKLGKVARHNLDEICGCSFGALGVLQCIAASTSFADGSARSALATAGSDGAQVAALMFESTGESQ